jgi:serine/threonine-protein kinase
MGKTDPPIGTDELLREVARVPAVALRAGDYELKEVLGKGGMGAVYIGKHPVLGRRAVKVINEVVGPEQREGLEHRFKTEARALSQLDHPNIVQIYEFGHLEDGRPYYVMELLQGKTLRQILGPDMELPGHPRKRLPTELALGYLRQICAGLQVAHERQIFHRDLKPDNVFVKRGDPPVAKILDFGVAKMLAATLVNVTNTQGALGTPLYMPPEQMAGRHDAVGAHNDIYSVGVLTYRMLSGKLPFDLSGAVGKQLAAGRLPAGPLPVVPLHQVAPHVPRRLAHVVDQCLKEDPTERPPSARVLFESCADGAVTTLPMEVVLGWKERISSKPLLMFLLGCAAMGLIVGAALLAWSLF